MLEDADSRETKSSAKLLQLVDTDSCFKTARAAGLVFALKDSELVSLERLEANVSCAGSDASKNDCWLVSMSYVGFVFTFLYYYSYLEWTKTANYQT